MSVLKLVSGSICILSGLALVVFGITLKWYIFPTVLEVVLNKEIDLVPGTGAWDAWVRSRRTCEER